MTAIPDENTAARLAELFSTLGDPSRVRIVAALAADELNVGELAEQVALTHSAVSHHLRHLHPAPLSADAPSYPGSGKPARAFCP